MARDLGIEGIDDGGEILAATGVILPPAKRAGETGAAEVQTEYRIAARQKESGSHGHVAAALGAGDAVNQHDQRPIKAAGGSIDRHDHVIAAAVLERDDQSFALLSGQGMACLERVIAQRLQVTAPPRAAGAESGGRVDNRTHVTPTLSRQKCQQI